MSTAHQPPQGGPASTQQQQNYGPPISPPRPPAPPAARKPGLLDIRFTRYLSLSLISVWYVVALIVIALAAVVGVLVGLFMLTEESESGPMVGVLVIFGSVIGAVVLGVITRLTLEGIAVLFRVATNTSEIAENTRRR